MAGEAIVRGSRRTFIKLAAAGIAAPAGAAKRPRAGGVERTAGLRTRADGEAVLACGGDFFLTRRLSGVVDAQTEAVFDVFRQADAGFVNLENGLSTVGSAELGGFKQGAALRGHPDLAPDLAWAGVRAVSLANNHTGNYGRDALLETIRSLDSARIGHAGAGANIAESLVPALVHAGGLTIALVSVYSLYHGFGAADQATASDPGVAVCRAYDVVVQPQMAFDTSAFSVSPYLVQLRNPASHTTIAALGSDIDRLKAAVHQVSAKADFTVLSVHVHWGRHTKHDLPPNLRPFAHEMIDAGVDLFVGHGPHCIRGIELYRGRPIVHSVGNLVLMPPSRGATSQVDSPAHEALIVRATVAKRSVRSLEILPIAIDDAGNPRFPSAERAARTMARLIGLSAPFGTEIPLTDWFGSVALT